MFKELTRKLKNSDAIGGLESTHSPISGEGRGIWVHLPVKAAARLVPFILLATILLTSCNEEFEKFTDVTKLRVMAVQVEPAELLPGDTGEIRALVSVPDGTEVSYRWRWCPVPTNALTGHECPIDEETLVQLIAQGIDDVDIPAGVADIPGGSIFDLGAGESAQFSYVIDAGVLQMACQQVATQFGDDLPISLDCDDRFKTTVRLDVSAGGETLTAVKELNLLLNPEIVPNRNPEIDAVHLVTDQGLVPLNNSMQLPLPEKVEQNFRIAIRPDVSETFLQRSVETGEMESDEENLFMTWFITGGDTEFGRTSYIAGETPFEKLLLNSWFLPSFEESAGTATLFVVLQDERGGVAWTSRTVAVREGAQ